MRIIHGTRTLETAFERSVLTIGNFDGVHLGHRALLGRTVARAREVGAPAVVMTFEPHPMKVLAPDRNLKRIFDFDDQVEQMRALGVDALVVEPFSREFSQLAPERYLLDWIFRPFSPETMVVGYDFSFGANRGGSIDFLRTHASDLGFRVEVVPPLKVGDLLVSSSRIRQAIEAGDVALAEKLLGRPFYVRGLVKRGAGRGRTIGVPTANLGTKAESIPALGVYAARAEARGRMWPAAVNVGLNPTFVQDAVAATIEAHLIDFPESQGDLYGETMRVEFVERLRAERKFPSASALVEQIGQDIADARRLLGATAKKG